MEILCRVGISMIDEQIRKKLAAVIAAAKERGGMRRDIKMFVVEDAAREWMRMKNREARDGSIFCLVNGPVFEDGELLSMEGVWVVDLVTAAELGAPYRRE